MMWLCSSGDYLDTVTLPSNGTYRLAIDPVGSNTGSITTTLYDVPPDVPTPPPRVPPRSAERRADVDR